MTGRPVTLTEGLLQCKYIVHYPSHIWIHYWQKICYEKRSLFPHLGGSVQDIYTALHYWWGQVIAIPSCIQLLPCVCFVIIHALEGITVHLQNHNESYNPWSDTDSSMQMIERRYEWAKERPEIPVQRVGRGKKKEYKMIYNSGEGPALLTFLSQAQADCYYSVHV